MPNIELHGFDKEVVSQILRRIREVFADAWYRKEVIANRINDDPRDLDGNPAPFLRLVGTNKYTEEKAVLDSAWGRLLKAFPDCDLRLLELASFQPKKVASEAEVVAVI